MRKKLLIGAKRIGCEHSYSENINSNERERRGTQQNRNALQHAKIIPVETEEEAFFFVRRTSIATEPEIRERIEQLAKKLL